MTSQPEEQQSLGAAIEPPVRDVVSRRPGFVSANLHLSHDGHKVLNDLPWESLEVFERHRDDEDAQARIRPVIGRYTGRASGSTTSPPPHER